MILPVYFLSRKQQPVPGRLAACGWHCAPDGTLVSPEGFVSASALVFDDRIPLPGRPGTLVSPLLQAAELLGAETIILDLERPDSSGARALAEALAARFPTAAPSRSCAGDCTPIHCYRPGTQTFPDFLNASRGWAELRPIRETLQYETGCPLPPAEGTAQFSELLQCCYRACSGENGLLLELFDTPETFRRRFRAIGNHFSAAVGIAQELFSFDLEAQKAALAVP